MSTRNDAIVRVARKLHDIGSGALGTSNTLLSDTEIGEEVDAAVLQYSNDRPRERVIDVTGDGTSYIATSSLTGWVNDWSSVRMIDYPAGAISSTYEPTWLNPDEDWVLYQTAAARYVRLPNHTPSASETVRLTYTTAHTLDNSTDTIPTMHFDALCNLAASRCCVRLATDRAAMTDPTIAADVVNHQQGTEWFLRCAQAFLAQYQTDLGMTVGKDGVVSSGVAVSRTMDWDRPPSFPFRDWLLHPVRFR